MRIRYIRAIILNGSSSTFESESNMVAESLFNSSRAAHFILILIVFPCPSFMTLAPIIESDFDNWLPIP